MSTGVACFYPIFAKNHKICCLSLKNGKNSVLGLLNFGKISSTGAYKGVAYKKKHVHDVSRAKFRFQTSCFQEERKSSNTFYFFYDTLLNGNSLYP